MDDDLYIEEVPTQGGSYYRCVICGGTDDSTFLVAHTPGCTQDFREHIARTVGYA